MLSFIDVREAAQIINRYQGGVIVVVVAGEGGRS